jgi:dolichol-phosphate mannosyltransferase
VLVAAGRSKKYPPLVEPEISRDFIYITDICSAFIAAAAAAESLKGMSLNIGSGKKTTIREIALLVKKICAVPDDPGFGSMDNRDWDRTEWYANIQASTTRLDWRPEVVLEEGIEKIIRWQNEIDFDRAYCNYTRKI